MARECSLDLRGPDLLATTDDHVGEASLHADRPIGIDLTPVAGTQPSAGLERGDGRLRVEPVAAHERRPANQELTPAGRAHLNAGERLSGVHHPATRLGHPVGRHDSHARIGCAGLEIGTDTGPTDKDRPEARKVGPGIEQSRELRRHQ